MRQKDFFDHAVPGQEIPPLTKTAEIIGGYSLPRVFAISRLEKDKDQASARASEIGVESIHVAEVFGGPYLLQFLSQMMTGWLPDVRSWVEGGELNVRFVSVVKPGSVVRCRGMVKEKKIREDAGVLVCDVWVEKENGEKAVTGEAGIRFDLSPRPSSKIKQPLPGSRFPPAV